MSGIPESAKPIDYLAWFSRVIGWDAVLPAIVAAGSVLIAGLLKHQPPADILALVGLPVLAFLVRLLVGSDQIRTNACGAVVRSFQVAALALGLFILAMVDFFVALAAFVPKGRAAPDEVGTVCAAAIAAYVLLALFAMYPGRRPLPPVEAH